MRHILLIAASLAVTACATKTVEPVPDIVVDTGPTCQPLASLQAVQIPEVTETRTYINTIENPPYPDIEERQTVTRTKVPAYTVYRDASGQDVDVVNICEDVPPPPPEAIITTATPTTATPTPQPIPIPPNVRRPVMDGSQGG